MKGELLNQNKLSVAKSSKRENQYDLLRILCMVAVVFIHAVTSKKKSIAAVCSYSFRMCSSSLDVAKDGRTCRIEWDSSKPNGTPRKLCDVTRLNNLGWKAKVDVRRGIEISYDDFLHGNVRK